MTAPGQVYKGCIRTGTSDILTSEVTSMLRKTSDIWFIGTFNSITSMLSQSTSVGSTMKVSAPYIK